MSSHEVSADGESTARWAMRAKGFLGSIKAITHCARCGKPLGAMPHNQPRHFRDICTPFIHVICDPCYDKLPDETNQ